MDYRVQAGDSLSVIAARFDVTLAALEHANPQITNPGLIFPNEIVHIPTTHPSPPEHGPTSVPPHVVTYVVQSGDTKGGIAIAHNLELGALEAANPQITNPDLIHPGDVINIPGSNQHPHPSPAAPVSNDGAIAIEDVGYDLYRGGGSVDSWTRAACEVFGVPADDWAAGYAVLCRRESSGRPNAINDYDSNAWGPIQSDGSALHCSRGVAQCIPDTFAGHHASGTSVDIYDPIANIAASMNYVRSRYGVRSDGSDFAAKVQQADPNRSPRGY